MALLSPDLSLSTPRRQPAMSYAICTTCGTQFAQASGTPQACDICTDERQFVNPSGQHWTTLERLRSTHWQTIRRKATNLYGIGVEPKFGIGQRALLLRTPGGNFLWDCVSLLDAAVIELIHGIGGLKGIAISHPHYYTTMVEWSRAFDCPVYLHAADRRWVMRPDDAIQFWDADRHSLADGLTLVRCGGHFEGGTVLHWRDGAEGRGALLTGDIIQVAQDRNWVSFMRSYPNFIPLSSAAVHRLMEAVAPFEFDRVYGAFWGWVVESGAKQAVFRSAERYLRALGTL